MLKNHKKSPIFSTSLYKFEFWIYYCWYVSCSSVTVLVGSVLKWRAKPQCLHRQLKCLRVSKKESYGLSRICFEMTRQATMPSSKAWLCLADEQHNGLYLLPNQQAYVLLLSEGVPSREDASTSWPSSSGLRGHRKTYLTILESADHALFKMVGSSRKLGSKMGVPNQGPKSGSQIGVSNRGPKSGSQIGVPNRGPKSGSQMGVSQIEVQIRVPNRGPKSGSEIGVLNRGPKSGSKIGVRNRGLKSGSQIGVPNWGPKLRSQIGVPNRGPKSGSQIGVPNRGPKSGSQIGVPNRGPKLGCQIGVPNWGPKSGP
jgi:hypothetical protein